jgi:hypothetical protein
MLRRRYPLSRRRPSITPPARIIYQSAVAKATICAERGQVEYLNAQSGLNARGLY